MKAWVILSQLLTFGVWLYARLFLPKIEAFTIGNYYVIAHLMVFLGVMGSRALELQILMVLFVLGLAFGYTILRYYPEYKKYEATSRSERGSVISTAPRWLQFAVDLSAFFGAIGLIAFTLWQNEITFSRWLYLAFLPGAGSLVGLIGEVVDWRRRHKRSS